MSLPEDFSGLLEKAAVAFAAYEGAAGYSPVIVGGGAIAIQTLGAFMSGDLDLYAPNDVLLGKCLVGAGFKREDRKGRLRGGYYHPDYPAYGIEAISGQLFDGRSDHNRLLRIILDGDEAITTPSFEDMIADRLGQHAVDRSPDSPLLQQARLLFRVAVALDLEYLKRRVAEEGGSFELLN